MRMPLDNFVPGLLKVRELQISGKIQAKTNCPQ